MTPSKGKAAVRAPLPNPAAGSANPSASLSALWGYVQPALDHIVRSPTNDPARAPAIDLVYYASVHSHVYNYFTAQSESASAVVRAIDRDAAKSPVSGTDLYEQVDRYYADTARELLLGAPQDDAALVRYILPCFSRFAAGAASVNRLLNYVNRHYVKRAVDEDKGWLRINDVLESVAKTITADDTREKITARLREKRTDELRKWGFVPGGPGELAARAEACAEAASTLDRVVPLSSLALRRFRTEFIEPLLAVPKIKNQGKARVKNKIPKPLAAGAGPPLPKGRLACAVKDLLESKARDEEERARLISELAAVLKSVGVRPDHVLRKKLDKLASAPA